MTASLSAAMVAASLALVLVVGPRWVLHRGPDGAATVEQIPVDIVAGSVLVMVCAEVLVALRLFEWLGLMVTALGVAGCCRWRRARRREAPSALDVMSDQARALLYLLEAASDGGNERVKGGVRRWWREAVRPHRRVRSGAPPPSGLAWRLSLAAVLGGSLVVGSAYALGHVALVPAGNYRQLTAMGELGEGRMFPFGAEPIGVRAALATAAELTPASYEDVVRFAGPLLATAAIGMVCLLVLRATSRRDAALAAATLAAVAAFGRGGAGVEAMVTTSQAEALALVIALGGVALAMQHAASPSRASIRHLALATLGVVLVHPPTLLVLAPALVAAGVVVAVRQRRARRLVQVLLAGSAGALAGALPVLAALVAGAGRAVPGGDPARPVPGRADPLLVASVAGAALTLLLARSAVRAGRPQAMPGIVMAVTSLAWAGLARAGLPAPPAGLPQLPVVLLPIGAGLGLACLRRRALVPASLLAVAGLLAAGVPLRLPDLGWAVTEHDSAARALSRRLAGVTDMSYTVVGSDVSLSRVVGRTWRAELAKFTRQLSVEQAADPGFVLPVASDHILLVAELAPPGVAPGADPAGPGAAARRAEAEDRAATAERADEWMTIYARFHPGVAVVYEDAGVRVWSVRQTGNPAMAERFKLAFR